MLNVEILWMVFGIVIAAKVISCAIYPGFIEGVDRQNSERVKGGMSLQNGMWHGLPNDIIMRNVIYGNAQRNKLNRKSYARLCRVLFGRRLSLAQICRRNCFFYQGHPTTIFGKYLFGRRFEIQNFRNICCKISCLPNSPRIFEHRLL